MLLTTWMVLGIEMFVWGEFNYSFCFEKAIESAGN